MFLSLDAAREGTFHERFSRVQVWGTTGLRRPDLHGDHVAIAISNVCKKTGTFSEIVTGTWVDRKGGK